MDKFLPEYKGKNKAGETIQIVHVFTFGEDRGYSVMRLCGNYQLGKIRWTWRWITQGQTLDEAIKVFNRRTAKAKVDA